MKLVPGKINIKVGRWYQSVFKNVEYQIPDSMLEGKDQMRVKYEVRKGSTAGEVNYIRLLKN